MNLICLFVCVNVFGVRDCILSLLEEMQEIEENYEKCEEIMSRKLFLPVRWASSS